MSIFRPGLGRRMLRRLVFLLLFLVILSAGLVLSFRWLPPLTSSYMLQDEYLHELWIDYRWLPLKNVSPHLRRAMLAADNQIFMEDLGLNVDSLVAALKDEPVGDESLRPSRSIMASQVSRNLFLWRKEGPVRDVMEAYFSQLIDWFWPRGRVLEVYVNIAEFGPGIYGVEAASQRTFKHSAIRLSAKQAAQIAAILPNPKVYAAGSDDAFAQLRSRWLRKQMEVVSDVSLASPGRRR